MKYTIERNVLYKVLGHVQSVVEKRNTIPILSNILIECKNDQVRFVATDMQIEIKESVNAQIEEPGSVTVLAHLFYDIIRKLPDGSQAIISSNEDNTSLDVVCGKSKFHLQCLPSEEYPLLSVGDMSHKIDVKTKKFLRILQKTKFAISNDETRYYLNGIYLHSVKNEAKKQVLRGVATDGHRLAQYEIELPDGAKDMPGIIFPRKAVYELIRLLNDWDEDIHIELSDTKIQFSFGSIVFTSKLIDGTFPDYNRVIPQSNDKNMNIDSDLFAESVDRVSTIAFKQGKAVKLQLNKDKLTLSANDPDSGNAEEEIRVEYDEEEIIIGFNPSYLSDVIKEIESGVAKFNLYDASSPVIIKDNNEDNYLYVLMPMRV